MRCLHIWVDFLQYILHTQTSHTYNIFTQIKYWNFFPNSSCEKVSLRVTKWNTFCTDIFLQTEDCEGTTLYSAKHSRFTFSWKMLQTPVKKYAVLTTLITHVQTQSIKSHNIRCIWTYIYLTTAMCQRCKMAVQIGVTLLPFRNDTEWQRYMH